jgi:Ca2+-binding RTX toxin-like protein
MRHEQGKSRAWFIIEQLERRQLLSTPTMGGTVQEDADGDGKYPTGISGVTVFIDANDNGVLNAGEKSTVTDITGWFLFNNLPLGRYVVRHIVPPGLTFAWRYNLSSSDPLPVTADSLTINVANANHFYGMGFIDVPYVVIDGTSAADVITVAPDPAGVLVTINGSSQVHSVAGTSGLLLRGHEGRDEISVDGQLQLHALIFGDEGNDLLQGGAGNDRILGGAGNDQIFGGDGDDQLIGDMGNNHLAGGAGNDQLDDTGSNGRSTLEGNDGNDRLYSSFASGLSLLSGGDGNDLLQANSHRVTLVGGSGDDTLESGYDDTTLLGGAGNDKLSGAVRTYVSGGAGDDRLWGFEGDTMVGGSGTDVMTLFEGTHLKFKSMEKLVWKKRPKQQHWFHFWHL